MKKIYGVVQKIGSNKAITNTYMFYYVHISAAQNTSTYAQFFVDKSMNICAI